MDTVALFKRMADGYRERLGKVTDWTVETPCAEWDARALCNHVQNEIMWIPLLVRGMTIAEVGSSLDGDLLGEDPLAAWDAGVASVVDEIGAPGALDRTVELSSGERVADSYVREVIADVTVHTWDVARAIGADESLDPELVALASELLTPVIEAARAYGAFGPAVEVSADASAQDKLIALTGRTP